MDTIFAPLTIKGNCSLYVIRVSGKKVKECLDVFKINKELKHREATFCVLKDDNNQILDEAILIYFQAPHSFTGEDVLELNLHCSNYIITKVIEMLSSIDGVRMAERGEFSKRAFLNNKIDLMQAESIVALIKSETELQHKLAIQQLQGNQILEILSLLEAYIDFPEEDIPTNIINEINDKVENIIKLIEKNLDDKKVGEKIKDGFHIAIIGEPNTGKSTLLNYLSKRDIAIVSNIAGTTRDIIEVNLDINGIPVILYDTAGIRKTDDVIESEGVKRAINKAKQADLKILLLSIDNMNINEEIAKLIDNETIILLNKIDLQEKVELNNIKNINTNNIIKIYLKDEINLDNFIKILQDKLESIISPNIDTTITNERYRQELIKALQYLQEFNFDNPIEINAENIRGSAECIGRITGKINSDEILNNIFSKFCIGK